MGTRDLALGSAGYLCHLGSAGYLCHFYRHRATFSPTAPLLSPPRHWRELKKVAHVAVALKQKLMAWWQWRRNKMGLIRAISVPFSNQNLHRNGDKLLLF